MLFLKYSLHRLEMYFLSCQFSVKIFILYIYKKIKNQMRTYKLELHTSAASEELN